MKNYFYIKNICNAIDSFYLKYKLILKNTVCILMRYLLSIFIFSYFDIFYSLSKITPNDNLICYIILSLPSISYFFGFILLCTFVCVALYQFTRRRDKYNDIAGINFIIIAFILLMISPYTSKIMHFLTETSLGILVDTYSKSFNNYQNGMLLITIYLVISYFIFRNIRYVNELMDKIVISLNNIKTNKDK